MAITLNLDLVEHDTCIAQSITDLSYAVYSCSKIVVITGAGISSSSGIPASTVFLLYILLLP